MSDRDLKWKSQKPKKKKLLKLQEETGNKRCPNTAKSLVKVRENVAMEQIMLNRPPVDNGKVIHIL